MMDATSKPNTSVRVNQKFLPSAPPLEGEGIVDPLSRLSKNLSIDSSETDAPSAPFAERLPYVNPSSQIELTISARSLLNLDPITQSDPLCVVFIQDSTTSWEWMELGRTETICNNLNPEWKTKFIVDYRFEERQMLELIICDKDCRRTQNSQDNLDFLGKLQCSVGEVVSAPRSRFTRSLRLPSIHSTSGVQPTATIDCEEIGECKKTMRFQIMLTDLDKTFFAKSTSQNIFVDISKQTPGGSWVLLHRTDKIHVTATFPTVSLRLSSVCSKGNVEALLRFQLYVDKHKAKSSKLIGQIVTNYIELTEKCSGNGVANFHLSRTQPSSLEQNLTSGMSINILNLRTEIQKTFMDHLQEGLELNYAVAIDFTASNGDPKHLSSLHYNYGERDNPYVATLKILDGILKDYSYMNEWNAYGFGAKGFPLSNRVNHKFALNFKETNPICQGMEQVLSSYHRTLQRVKLFGPTCFAPIIREVTQLAKGSLQSSSTEKYFVLFLLTDGVVCDPDTTRDALVEASNAPMSIIIIGIGDEDFNEMEKMDSDGKLLKSRSNKKAVRDIVQFVELKKFINIKSVIPISAGSKAALTRSVLAELPQQVVSWKNLKHGVV
ncbi:unnamed protein product [Orchesella dallaii]|uniref:C2 domain-containing protein n=1 Tax=Orchesella dallaii TaxID=48710 RepID=A0ABP1PRJ9_9HEXA